MVGDDEAAMSLGLMSGSSSLAESSVIMGEMASRLLMIFSTSGGIPLMSSVGGFQSRL